VADEMTRSAVFSPERLYRYSLTRRWADGPIMNVIGLNPSTADETTDDPTIRRCIALARRNGYGALIMTNLFAFRATSPTEMKQALEPIGIDNDPAIYAATQYASGMVVAAWGTQGAHVNRGRRVLELLRYTADVYPLWCLGVTRDGHPKHPLYLPNTANPIRYEAMGTAYADGD